MFKINNTYIDGKFVENNQKIYFDLINPASEDIYGKLECTSIQNTEKAILSASAAEKVCANLSINNRKNILLQILEGIIERRQELAEIISLEMGAPINLSKKAHVQMGIDHLENTIKILDNYKFETIEDGYKILRMPIGVVALITPWNWPLNQTLTKLSSAIAAGCSIIMKPSEFCALSSRVLAEIINNSDMPNGGFNMVNGIGAELGPIMSEHEMINMISFTGSTEVGINIQELAAKTVKRGS